MMRLLVYKTNSLLVTVLSQVCFFLFTIVDGIFVGRGYAKTRSTLQAPHALPCSDFRAFAVNVKR